MNADKRAETQERCSSLPDSISVSSPGVKQHRKNIHVTDIKMKHIFKINKTQFTIY